MARNFHEWTTDPLFPVAEQVQDSADRLDSAFRAWRRAVNQQSQKKHRIDPVEEDDDASCSTSQRTLPSLHNDLTTALSTAKWQLEEFEKASVAAPGRRRQKLQIYWRGLQKQQQGEDDDQEEEEEEEVVAAFQRRQQFIVAIRNQITIIHNAFRSSQQQKESAPIPKLSNGDDNFARFLSGHAPQTQEQVESAVAAASIALSPPPHVHYSSAPVTMNSRSSITKSNFYHAAAEPSCSHAIVDGYNRNISITDSSYSKATSTTDCCATIPVYCHEASEYCQPMNRLSHASLQLANKDEYVEQRKVIQMVDDRRQHSKKRAKSWVHHVLAETKHAIRHGTSKHALKRWKDGDHTQSDADVALDPESQCTIDDEPTMDACFCLRPLLRSFFPGRLPILTC